MELTESFINVFKKKIKNKYVFCEVRNASAVLSISCKREWEELCDALSGFELKTESLMKPGGNKSSVVKGLEALFYSRGWEETRVDSEEFVYKIPRKSGEKVPIKLDNSQLRDQIRKGKGPPHIDVTSIYQEGYLVDALKGRLAVDIEWNAKDGNLDRDFSAYRAWYDLGLIDGAVLITKDTDSCRKLVGDIWKAFCQKNPKYGETKIPVDLGTATTTSIKKGESRIKRGDAGGCPVLIVGITDKCWDGIPLSVENVSVKD